MMNDWGANNFTIRINSNDLTIFYEICKHYKKVNIHGKDNLNKNNSTCFQYLIDNFNNGNINLNNPSKLKSNNKKDKKICIYFWRNTYIPYLNRCKELNIKQTECIRLLIYKFIQENIHNQQKEA